MESLAKQELPPTAERRCDTYHPVLEYRVAGTTGASEIQTVRFTGERTAKMQFERCMEWATSVAEDCECRSIFTDQRPRACPIFICDRRLMFLRLVPALGYVEEMTEGLGPRGAKP